MTTLSDVTSAQRCVGTPTLAVVDNRGLAIRSVQYNRSAIESPLDELITRQTYSALGQLLSSIDPRLYNLQQLDAAVKPNFSYVRSLSGQAIHTVSQDAGYRIVLFDVAGGVVEQQDSRFQVQQNSYDTLHRLTQVSEYNQGEAELTHRVSERFVYADDSSLARAANGRGRLWLHYSPAGLTVTPSYSQTGQVLSSQQQFLRDDILHSNWSGVSEAAWTEDLAAEERYVSHWAYNAQDVVVLRTDASGNQQQQRLNIAGQLATSAFKLSDSSEFQPLLRTITYSAAGQVWHEEAGNGVITDYFYERQTLRLSALKTTRAAKEDRSPLLQSLSYEYDPMGNLLTINDEAKATRYNHNQKVMPANSYQYDALYQLRQASGRENASGGQQGQSLPPAIIPLWDTVNQLINYTRVYSYDRGGNLIATTYQGGSSAMVVSGSSNRAVKQSGGISANDVNGYFDGCGNLKALAPGQPLEWNSRNQLLRTTQVIREASEDDSEVYWYDSQGQRATKLGTALTGNTSRRQRVRYLPGLEIRQTEQQQNSVITPVERLQVVSLGTAGRQSVRLLHWDLGKPVDIDNNQLRYSLDDQIGSSVLELNQTADILTWEEYYPFGGTAVWSARSESETQYKFVRYSGKERDATGLYYYGLRYYAPWLGRWLNPDPVGTVDGLNLFCMVGNNPVNFADYGGGVSYTAGLLLFYSFISIGSTPNPANRYQPMEEMDLFSISDDTGLDGRSLTSQILIDLPSGSTNFNKSQIDNGWSISEWEQPGTSYQPTGVSEMVPEGEIYSSAFNRDIGRSDHLLITISGEQRLRPGGDSLNQFEAAIPDTAMRGLVATAMHQGVVAPLTIAATEFELAEGFTLQGTKNVFGTIVDTTATPPTVTTELRVPIIRAGDLESHSRWGTDEVASVVLSQKHTLGVSGSAPISVSLREPTATISMGSSISGRSGYMRLFGDSENQPSGIAARWQSLLARSLGYRRLSNASSTYV